MILPCCFFFSPEMSVSSSHRQSLILKVHRKQKNKKKKTDYVRIFTQPFCVIWQCLAHSSALDHRRCQRCSPSPGLTHGWGQRNPSHLATFQKRPSMWCGAAPENNHSQRRREQLRRQLRLERDLTAPPVLALYIHTSIKYRFQESMRLLARNLEWTVTFPCRSWCLWSS